jgi:long-chain acyl-CoA synthetase
VEKTLHEALDLWAAQWPEDVALISSSGKRMTYRELSSLSRSIANSLRKMGVSKGDAVALVAYNSVELIAAFFGCVMSGAAAVMIDPATLSEDLKFQLEDSRSRVVVADSAVLERELRTFKEAGVERVLLLDGDRGPKGDGVEVKGLPELASEEPLVSEEVRVDPTKDPAIVFYYAGIAGRTEQVLHSQAAPLRCAEVLAKVLRLPRGENTMLIVPLQHVLGLIQVLIHLSSGGSVTVLERKGGGFDEMQVVEVAGRFGANSIWSAPILYIRLVSRAGEVRLPSSIKYCSSGGGYLPPEVQRAFIETFGVPLVQGYGLTEGWVVTYQPLEMSDRLGTIGLPLPGVELKIVRDDGTEVRNPGEVGELYVRSPWIMLGYSDPRDTERAIVDGWLRTGDLVSVDETGLLYFRGVKKRMIKYKGYPIFPRDLEEILKRHPAVKEALVKGEPDREVGERPVGYVVLREGYEGKVSEGELMGFVNSKVAGYKKLRALHIVRSFEDLKN